MPTYAYACKDCSHAFDIVQSFTDSTLTSCPECQGTLRKKFNSVGVVFKGSGFYRTDSRDSKAGGVSAAAPSTAAGAATSAPASSGAASSTAATSSTPAPAAAK
ncbi:FmdB family zinc ribbon protein [Arthrobacter rhizosphaerae]|uniref:FmdB family zinc ribbon protein n=1 Tax=Arthrobacter rhizosphaerae TaxID=2855490 RepID=UPI001FF22ED6|nr:FmdB family zinc ribbon protein [Arthrobacter rhizosphaerae]